MNFEEKPMRVQDFEKHLECQLRDNKQDLRKAHYSDIAAIPIQKKRSISRKQSSKKQVNLPPKSKVTFLNTPVKRPPLGASRNTRSSRNLDNTNKVVSIKDLQRLNEKVFFKGLLKSYFKKERACDLSSSYNKNNRISDREPSLASSERAKREEIDCSFSEVGDKENQYRQQSSSSKFKKRPLSANKKKIVAKFEEDLRFQPKLTKKSMVMASSMENPMERLTKKSTAKKSSQRRKDNNFEKELTFAPKLNSKSIYLTRNRNRSGSRFEELHKLADEKQKKIEKAQIEKEIKLSAEELECQFKPDLIASYEPAYAQEMDFIARSYLWQKKKEEKLSRARKQKDEDDQIYTFQPSIKHSKFTKWGNSESEQISIEIEEY